MNRLKSSQISVVVSLLTLLLGMGGSAGAEIIATDDVESDVYTYTGTIGSNHGTDPSGTNGLTALAGSLFMTVYYGNSDAHNGTVRLTSGFGPSAPIAAGTYTLTVYAGQGAIVGKTSFTTFDALLATTGGTELPNKTVIKSYVDPLIAYPSTAMWVETVIQYKVPAESALIGEEFTWGFNWTKEVYSNWKFYAAWDAASVDFVPLPPTGTVIAIR